MSVCSGLTNLEALQADMIWYAFIGQACCHCNRCSLAGRVSLQPYYIRGPGLKWGSLDAELAVQLHVLLHARNCVLALGHMLLELSSAEVGGVV